MFNIRKSLQVVWSVACQDFVHWYYASFLATSRAAACFFFQSRIVFYWQEQYKVLQYFLWRPARKKKKILKQYYVDIQLSERQKDKKIWSNQSFSFLFFSVSWYFLALYQLNFWPHFFLLNNLLLYFQPGILSIIFLDY